MRRIALTLALGFCAAAPAFAQIAEDLPLVGFLRVDSYNTIEPHARLFRDAMAALGQVNGRNVCIEFRLAEGHVERFPELADALVREKAGVILATGIPAILAAQHATSTIPIVADDDDLLAEGVVRSLACRAEIRQGSASSPPSLTLSGWRY
jgi:putative tryptophan/tyrosine transport system substrate-binding protein